MTPAPNLERLKIDRAALSARPRRRRRWLWLAAAVAVALALWLYLRPGATVVEVARAEPPTRDTGQVVLSAGGYIVAHHTINVNSKVTGRVAWVGVERGDQVRQGQVLVRLEDQEFRAQVVADTGAVAAAKAYLDELTHGSRPQEIAAAQANLQQAQATERNNRLALARTQALFAKGIVAKSQLDADQAAYDASRQLAQSLAQTLELAQIGTRPEAIARAEGALQQAQGNLQYARTLLDATVIRAPVGGTILERTAEKGELITAQFASAVETGGPQGSVVTLADLNDLQVELDISQNDFGRLQLHQPGIVTTDAFPDRRYQGELAEIAPEANRQKATVQVKVKVLDPDSRLRPDMNATVQFLADQALNAPPPAGVLIPLVAIRDRAGAKYVQIIANGRVAERPIQVTAERALGSIATGVAPGTEVIVKTPAELKPGARVVAGTLP